MNYILIPIYGFIGASISTFFTFAFQSVLFYISAQRLYKIPYNLAKITIPIFITFLFYYFGLKIDYGNTTILGQLSIRFLLLAIYIPVMLAFTFDSEDIDLLKLNFKLKR